MDIAISVVGYIGFFLGLGAGLLLLLFGLPGNWIIALDILALGLMTKWQYFSYQWMYLFVGLVLLGELLEFWLSYGVTKKYGASNWGAFGAVLGGIIGALLGSIIPIFLIGPLLGLAIGTMVGAYLFEYLRLKDKDKSMQASKGALIGRAFAISVKIMIGLAMCIIVIWLRWF